MTIEEILQSVNSPAEFIAVMKDKTIAVPMWAGKKGLEQEYDPKNHPVMDRQKYPDIVTDDGIEEVTRVALDLQRLATKRMSELVCGIPVKRIYKPKNDKQKLIATFIEAIYDRNRIDSVNTERCNMLFAGCEVFTLWYAVEEDNTLYGNHSPLKFRCRNFSPMQGDELYPFFDETGDMIAMSVGYRRKVGKKQIQFFDTYTKDKHIKFSTASGEWDIIQDENITLGKIPGIYIHRPSPIWEDTSKTVYEMEWALSRNGNYLRQNSKPLFVLFADEEVAMGNEKQPEKEFKGILQYPKGSTAQYVTWQQAVENLKYYVGELRSLFFTQLQLPDWSYEKMSQQALSGESRKQMFIDCQLKVKDESGRLIEGLDREMNVVKAFAKAALGDGYSADVDALSVEHVITPFMIADEKDTIGNLMAANGGEPIMSQREAIEAFGHSEDVEQTLKEIEDQKKYEMFEPTI